MSVKDLFEKEHIKRLAENAGRFVLSEKEFDEVVEEARRESVITERNVIRAFGSLFQELPEGTDKSGHKRLLKEILSGVNDDELKEFKKLVFSVGGGDEPKTEKKSDPETKGNDGKKDGAPSPKGKKK